MAAGRVRYEISSVSSKGVISKHAFECNRDTTVLDIRQAFLKLLLETDPLESADLTIDDIRFVSGDEMSDGISIDAARKIEGDLWRNGPFHLLVSKVITPARLLAAQEKFRRDGVLDLKQFRFPKRKFRELATIIQSCVPYVPKDKPVTLILPHDADGVAIKDLILATEGSAESISVDAEFAIGFSNAVFSAIWPMLHRIKVLSIPIHSSDEQAEGFTAVSKHQLSALLRGSCITTLDITRARLDEATGLMIAADLQHNRSLQILALRKTEIGDVGVLAIAKAVGLHPSLRILRVGTDATSSREVVAAFEVAVAQSNSLEELYIGGYQFAFPAPMQKKLDDNRRRRMAAEAAFASAGEHKALSPARTTGSVIDWEAPDSKDEGFVRIVDHLKGIRGKLPSREHSAFNTALSEIWVKGDEAGTVKNLLAALQNTKSLFSILLLPDMILSKLPTLPGTTRLNLHADALAIARGWVASRATVSPA